MTQAEDELKEIKRLRFVLDKDNRTFGITDKEFKELSGKLAKLERKHNINY